MKIIYITVLLIALSAISVSGYSQTYLWEEDFSVDPGTWTLETNWSITSGYLQLNWSPTQENYNLAATSPVITIPNNAGDLHVTQWINHFSYVNEAFEIAVLVDGDADVLWTHDDGTDWGSSGGELLSLSLVPYQNEDIQLRFRSWGASTWNINYWRIYHLAIDGSYDDDLEALSISGNITPSVGTSSNYTVTIRNIGMNTQYNYQVKLMKAGGIELATVQGGQIQTGEEIDFILSWIPAATEETYVYGEVFLAGDQDTGNNSTSSMNIYVQEQGVVAISVGTESNLSNHIPLNFSQQNSLTQTIYMASELNIEGLVTEITYYNSFVTNLTNKAVNIWIGETDEDDLSGGWIPATQLQPAFTGNVNFPGGTNQINITFDQPYEYGGSNLVIMAQRPMDTTQYNSSDRFLYSVTPDYSERSRHISSNTTSYDPANPTGGTLTNRVPNTTFFFITAGMGMLEGYVHDAVTNAPLSGVTMNIINTNYQTTTNSDGYYVFPYVTAGSYNVQASLFGYYSSVMQDVMITADETTSLNYSLTQLPTVTVSGRIVGSDAPGTGLDDAFVSIEGYYYYETDAGINGLFSIAGVYADQTYTMTVTRSGYSDLYLEIPVGDSDLDLGDVVINELAFPPYDVVATISDDNSEVYLEWNSPDNRSSKRIGNNRPETLTGPADSQFTNRHRERQISSNAPEPKDKEQIFHDRLTTNTNRQPISQHITGRGLVGFIIYRLAEGQEESPDEWCELITIMEIQNSYTDTDLSPLVNGNYLYAVRSVYSNNVLSDYTLSNPVYYQEHIPDITDLQAELDGNNVHLNWEWDDNREICPGEKGERAFLGFTITRNNEIISEDTMETNYYDTGLPSGTHTYTVIGMFTNGNTNMLSTELTIFVSVEEEETLHPLKTALHGNRPNPFNPETTIRYDLDRRNRVIIEIFNIKGQLVKTLTDEYQTAGEYSVNWNGKDQSGMDAGSGIFFYRLKSGNYEAVRKMILLK